MLFRRPNLIAAGCFLFALVLMLCSFYLFNPDYLRHFELPMFGKPTLRRQLSSLCPYNSSGTFPAIIWQTYKYAPSEEQFPIELRGSQESWTTLNPGYVHTVANDSFAAALVDELFAGVPSIYEAYDALPEPVLKADFFRYLILFAKGGVYSDIDTTALKPVTKWIPKVTPSYGLVTGIEADADREDWAEWYARRVQFCQWTIASKPGHPILLEVVATITEETLRRRELGQLNETSVKMYLELTGPGVWTDKIFEYFNDARHFDISDESEVTWHRFTNLTQATQLGDVMVLPITSFSPGVGHMGAGTYKDPMAFVKHAFAGSWKDGNKIAMDRIVDIDTDNAQDMDIE